MGREERKEETGVVDYMDTDPYFDCGLVPEDEDDEVIRVSPLEKRSRGFSGNSSS